MTRRASAMLGATRVSSGGAGSVLVWTLTQNTLDRARDEGEMQLTEHRPLRYTARRRACWVPNRSALRRGTVTAALMSGRCLAGEEQRGCWWLIRWCVFLCVSVIPHLGSAAAAVR